MIDSDLLDIMVCPVTGDKLQQQGDWLVNTKWGLRYPVRNGIPIMLPEQAQLPQGIASISELKAQIAAAKK